MRHAAIPWPRNSNRSPREVARHSTVPGPLAVKSFEEKGLKQARNQDGKNRNHVELFSLNTDLYETVYGRKSQTFVIECCEGGAVGGIKPYRRRQQQARHLPLSGLLQDHVHHNEIVCLQLSADAVQVVHRACVHEVRDAVPSVGFEVHQTVQMGGFALQRAVAVQSHHTLSKKVRNGKY